MCRYNLRGLFCFGVLLDAEHVPVIDEGGDVRLFKTGILVRTCILDDVDRVGDFPLETQDVPFGQNGAAKLSLGSCELRLASQPFFRPAYNGLRNLCIFAICEPQAVIERQPFPNAHPDDVVMNRWNCQPTFSI